MAGFTAGQGGQEEPGVSKFSFLAERLVILYNRPDEGEAKVSYSYNWLTEWLTEFIMKYYRFHRGETDKGSNI